MSIYPDWLKNYNTIQHDTNYSLPEEKKDIVFLIQEKNEEVIPVISYPEPTIKIAEKIKDDVIVINNITNDKIYHV